MYHILLFNHSLTATLMKNRNLKEKLNWLHSHRVNNEIKKIFSLFLLHWWLSGHDLLLILLCLHLVLQILNIFYLNISFRKHDSK